jgi:hypothetical protein
MLSTDLIDFGAGGPMSGGTAKSGWICPKCGRRFARTNQGHVCETWSVEDLLRELPSASITLYLRFVALMAACGTFDYSVTKQNIGFRGARRIFAGVRPVADGLHGHLDLTRQVEDHRFGRVAPYTKRLFVHSFHITSESQLDQEFAGWVCEAYAVGQGRHLK